MNMINPFGNPLKGKKKLGVGQPDKVVTPEIPAVPATPEVPPDSAAVAAQQREEGLAMIRAILELFPDILQDIQPQQAQPAQQ